MSLQVTCSNCGQSLRVPETSLGHQARCPRCQNTFVVQTPQPGAAAALASASRSGIFPAQQLGMPPMPRSPQPAPDAWYLNSADGKSFGPIPKAQLDSWVLQGLVGGGDYVLQQGDQQWRTAGELYPLLAGGGSAAPSGNAFPSVNSGGFPAINTGSSGGFSTGSSGKVKRPHRGGTILMLGILGWTVCGPLCIAAWVMGSDDLKQMRAGRMDRSGHDMTYFGVILGMIGSILMLISLVIAVPMIILAAAAGPR